MKLKKYTLRRTLRFWNRRLREWRLIAKGLVSTSHPVQVHMIPIRRCNLACGYCNEFDDYSPPVPTEEMIRRVDRLASFGTTLITISGGEPLLHPELEKIIARIRSHGILAGLITNGYLLTKDRIESLNRAGLDHLQISIDNAQPDDVSMKSLKVLDKKLQLLAEHAEFHVNINSVVGSGVRNPEDALTVARRAQELGLTSTVGIIHDGSGQLKPLGTRDREIFETIMHMRKRSYSRFKQFQWNIAHGKPNQWSCRAGSRYLYICEDGLVHYCSQQRGLPGVPLEKYTKEDLQREYYTRKDCAPYCTISCVQQTAMMDNWRAPQRFPQPALAGYAGYVPALRSVREPQPLVQLTGARAED
jgi:MoaA/NifB/PqqE/SkfB family radical SAM enzyme